MKLTEVDLSKENSNGFDVSLNDNPNPKNKLMKADMIYLSEEDDILRKYLSQGFPEEYNQVIGKDGKPKMRDGQPCSKSAYLEFNGKRSHDELK